VGGGEGVEHGRARVVEGLRDGGDGGVSGRRDWAVVGEAGGFVVVGGVLGLWRPRGERGFGARP
jgi:hypothetical protein